MSSETVKVSMDVKLPEGATIDELVHMLDFCLLGHIGKPDIISKFDYEVEVDDYQIIK